LAGRLGYGSGDGAHLRTSGVENTLWLECGPALSLVLVSECWPSESLHFAQGIISFRLNCLFA
jgi:hypothetical protein